MTPFARNYQRGFSLVELTVVVVIVALISVAMVSLVPLGGQALKQQHAATTMERANQSLLGYLQANLKLPFADADGDGRADAGTVAGWLPYQDLGLESPLRLAYTANPAFVAPPGDEFSPYYDDTTLPSLPIINGLDLCRHMLNTASSAAPLAALGMPAAYALAQPAAGVNLSIETLAKTQTLPGEHNPNVVMSHAEGIGELASQLACSDRLGRAQGAAQSAFAAVAIADLALFNYQFRSFDVRTSQAMLAGAEAGLAAAVSSLAFGIFDQSIAIFLTVAGWPPSVLGGIVGFSEMGVAAGSILYGVNQIILSEKDVEGAKETLTDAEAARERAHSQYLTSVVLRNTAIAEAQRIDRLGISR